MTIITDRPRYEETGRQEYSGNNCVFSAGIVEGFEMPCDTVYLRFERDGHTPITFHVRPDEAQAICWLLNGALWSERMRQDFPDEADEAEDKGA